MAEQTAAPQKYTPLHLKVNPTLGAAVKSFAISNDVTLNRAAIHLLTLGLNEMKRQHGGSIMHYLNNISLKDQEIH